MAVLTTVSGAGAALDAAAAALSSGNNKDTVTKIAAYLKNRRGLLSEIVNAPADPALLTFANNDGAGGDVDVLVLDHLG